MQLGKPVAPQARSPVTAGEDARHPGRQRGGRRNQVIFATELHLEIAGSGTAPTLKQQARLAARDTAMADADARVAKDKLAAPAPSPRRPWSCASVRQLPSRNQPVLGDRQHVLSGNPRTLRATAAMFAGVFMEDQIGNRR